MGGVQYNLGMDSQLVTLEPQGSGELYLVGFRLDPAAIGPQFYTLVGSRAQSERPITSEGRILLFRSPELAARALEVSDNGFAALRPIPNEIELLCDIGEALHVANQEDADADGVLFEMIAVFDDLLREVRISPPNELAVVLAQVAGRLGENPEFASFLQSEKIVRERIEDALLWCVGALMAKSRWVG